MPMKYVRLILVVFIILVPVFALYLYYSYGYVELKIANPGTGNLDVEIRKAGAGQSSKLTTQDGTAKKLVRRGNYELVARKDGSNHISVVRSGGFLGTTKAEGGLEKEKSRRFIGDNPGPCAHFGEVLISLGCSDKITQTLVHRPATAKLPTYTEPLKITYEGRMEGFAQTPKGSFMLARLSTSEEETKARGHYAHPVASNGSVGAGILLKDADKTKTYGVLPFKSGFILHDGFENILSYQDVAQPPEKFSVARPQGKKLRAYAISAGANEIAVAYSELNAVADAAGDEHSSNEKSTIVVRGSKQSKQFTFSKMYGQISLCGTSKLCLLFDGQLDVFDINGTKPRLLYSIGDVTSVVNSGATLLVVRGRDVLGFNVEKASGSIQYSLGLYSLCGMQPTNKGYVLCLLGANKKKVALYIEPSIEDTGSFDKKISELSNIPEVKTVSAYGNFVYISPNYGGLISTSTGFDIDRTKKPAVDKAIQEKIDALGIDRKTYTITGFFN